MAFKLNNLLQAFPKVDKSYFSNSKRTNKKKEVQKLVLYQARVEMSFQRA